MTASAFLVPTLAMIAGLKSWRAAVASSLAGIAVSTVYGASRAAGLALPATCIFFCMTVLASLMAFIAVFALEKLLSRRQ